MPAIHNLFAMHCQEPWFKLLRCGVKPVEGRKNSPRYRAIAVGDLIDFCNGVDTFRARVTEIRRYPTLEAYLHDVTVAKALPGVATLDEAIGIYHQWSTADEIARHGFLGIFIEPLSAPPLPS